MHVTARDAIFNSGEPTRTQNVMTFHLYVLAEIILAVISVYLLFVHLVFFGYDVGVVEMWCIYAASLST